MKTKTIQESNELIIWLYFLILIIGIVFAIFVFYAENNYVKKICNDVTEYKEINLSGFFDGNREYYLEDNEKLLYCDDFVYYDGKIHYDTAVYYDALNKIVNYKLESQKCVIEKKYRKCRGNI